MNNKTHNSPLEGWQAKPDGVDTPPPGCGRTPQEGNKIKGNKINWQNNSLFPYWTLPKNQKLKERARELRKQGILSEVIFWKKFKDKKALGWDIDKQVIIDNFIVDFFYTGARIDF
jgi:hypothetical protein